MSSAEESFQDISDLRSEDGFELIDADSSDENFICYQDEGWSVLLPSATDTLGLDNELVEVVSLNAEHSSLFSGNSANLTHSPGDSKNVLLRQEGLPVSKDSESEGIIFHHDHFRDDGEEEEDGFNSQADTFFQGKSSSEKSFHGEQNVDIDCECCPSLSVNLSKEGDCDRNSDSDDTELDSLPILSIEEEEEEKGNNNPSEDRKLSFSSPDLVDGEASELDTPLERNETRKSATSNERVPKRKPLCVKNENEDGNESSTSPTSKEKRSDKNFHLDPIYDDSSLTHDPSIKLTQKNKIEQYTKKENSEIACSFKEDTDPATLPPKINDDNRENFIDSELDNNDDEICYPYDHFVEKRTMHRKLDRFGCRLRKKQQRRFFSCYYHY